MGHQTLAFYTTDISKLFMIKRLSVFGLQRPQWRIIGGQNGGRIESLNNDKSMEAKPRKPFDHKQPRYVCGIKSKRLIPHTKYLQELSIQPPF